MPETLLSTFKKQSKELIQTIRSGLNKWQNEYNKNKLDRIFSNAEKEISKWENNPNALSIEKEHYKALLDGLWATIYHNSIATFVGTIEATCKKWKVCEVEYKQIEPLLEKWESKVNKIEENHKIGYQLFNDFRKDLKEFTEKYPNWIEDGSSMLELFDEKIWNPIFKSNYEKTLLLSKRIEEILGKNKGKIKTMIDSDYSLITPFELTSSLDYSIPDLLAGKINVSDPYQNYNSRGNPTSFGVDLDFHEIHLSRTLKSGDFYLLRGKIEDTLRTWESKYKRHLDKVHKENRAEHVDELNQEAKEAIESLNNILVHTLSVDDTVDWDAIKRKDAFRIKPIRLFNDGKEPSFINFNSYGRPTEFDKLIPPTEPTFEKVKNEYGFFSKLFRSKSIKENFDARIKKWEQQKEQTNKGNAERELIFNQAVSIYEDKKKQFEEEKQRDNEALENIKSRYKEKDPKAIEEYCDLVLNCSRYPDYFPQNWILEYREDSRIAVVEYDLPTPDQLPTVESYKYTKSRDEVSEKALTQAARKKLYDSAIYQICIRTIHELFEADVIKALDAVAFNGLVTNKNPATGIEETKLILSVVANKEQFMSFDLSQVDPKATFKHMKGVAAANLVDLTPIPPIIQLDKSDKRFISGRNVVGNLDDSVNLAAMHWDDFEHLIRELFEKEFATSGGEVKVTQASADRGVDAIAFDPDPIRGGKIVIQAKRYTNVVGVAAVRDLYGTVMNEGATKGILVTTSDYGKDSYEFAKDKPITLLNGSNLLSLLEKHGHKARINIAEAKKIIKG